jgi:hypothetical protein
MNSEQSPRRNRPLRISRDALERLRSAGPRHADLADVSTSRRGPRFTPPAAGMPAFSASDMFDQRSSK